MEKCYLVVNKNSQKRETDILYICKTPEGAVSKIRERVKDERGWTDRYNGTLWNNGDECLRVTERDLED